MKNLENIISAQRQIFSKLFQIRTGHGDLGKYFQTRGTKEWNHNCECEQLETIENVLMKFSLHSEDWDL